MTARRFLRFALLLFVLAVPASGQGTSPSYGLHDSALAGGGGPSSSEAGATAYATTPNVGSGEMSSPSFGSAAGFLETNEPEFPDHPVLFGLEPAFGPKTGGTLLQLSGVHFDYLGAGPTVAVLIGGVPALNVTIVSDTYLTCQTAAVGAGPHDVVVSSTWGQDVWTRAFVASPAVTSPALAVGGGTLMLENLGPPGGQFLVLWSLSETSQGVPPYGTLLVGPVFYVLMPFALYPGAGPHQLTYSVPADPILDGLDVFFQTLSFDPGGSAELTNSTGTTFLVAL